jgi:polysaccharide biosynthesis/export protein
MVQTISLFKRLFISFSFVLIAGLTGSLADLSAAVPNGQAAAQTSASSDVDRPVAAQRRPRYKICRDDVLTLSFPIAPEFNQKLIVQPDGYVNLQGVGSVYILGLTIPETVEAVKKAYAGTLHNPIVDVDLTDFQKPFFVALGQVGKPGQYDLRYDMTVTQAIAVAGGFSPQAKTQILLFHAVSGNTAEVKKLNMKEILNGKNVNEEVHLSPGDTIFVPEKAITKFRKYVPYGIGTSLNPNTALF